MHRKYFIVVVIIALMCAILIVISLSSGSSSVDKNVQPNTMPHPISPFRFYISGVGIVEPNSENRFIGTPVNRVVEQVAVSVGEKVTKGTVLFRLESRDLQADLFSRSVAYENAVAHLKKLEALPRQEDVIIAEAILKNAQIELNKAQSQYARVEGLQGSHAITEEEIHSRFFAVEATKSKVLQVQADLNKIKAGAWKPDLEISRLQAVQAKAQMQRVEADIERTIIRAPIDGTILQIKIHNGELPPADTSKFPPIILGNINPLHVRVSINQFDSSYYRTDAPAVAFLQGNAEVAFLLKFVRLEPYFVNKQNLTNDIRETVDTRVIQAIYCFDKDDQRIFVGQQMDVFIETKNSPVE